MKFLEVENKKVNWKYISIVILFAALAGGLSFIYLDNFPVFSEIPLVMKRIEPTEPTEPTEIDPTGWKVFTNNELGFSFKYPAKWGGVEEEIWDADMSGKGYSLRFANIDYGEFGSKNRVYATGRSNDFGAGRGRIDEDYMGDISEPKQVVSTIHTRPSSCVVMISVRIFFGRIDFNLPGKEISGVRLFIPILSEKDIIKISEKVDKEYLSLSSEERKRMCANDDFIEEAIGYLKRIKDEELDSISQERIEIFKEILNSSKVF